MKNIQFLYQPAEDRLKDAFKEKRKKLPENIK
jgi:hypothetical protein